MSDTWKSFWTTVRCIFIMLSVFCVDSQHSQVTTRGLGTNTHKELILTLQERVAFEKFKTAVYPNASQAHGFIKTDIYLLRWIQTRSFNVKRAIKEFFECLEWRRANRVDTINQENWSDMIAEHSYRFDAVDLQGRPVAYGPLNGILWNIRRSVLINHNRFSRFVIKLFEEAFDRTYEAYLKHSNITQFSTIIDLQGYSTFQQGCLICISTYTRMASVYNRYYPNFIHKLIIINNPPLFNALLEVIRPALNKETRNVLELHGYNKKIWKGVLDREISEDQLPRSFGGTRSDDDNENN